MSATLENHVEWSLCLVECLTRKSFWLLVEKDSIIMWKFIDKVVFWIYYLVSLSVENGFLDSLVKLFGISVEFSLHWSGDLWLLLHHQLDKMLKLLAWTGFLFECCHFELECLLFQALVKDVELLGVNKVIRYLLPVVLFDWGVHAVNISPRQVFRVTAFVLIRFLRNLQTFFAVLLKIHIFLSLQFHL